MSELSKYELTESDIRNRMIALEQIDDLMRRLLDKET